MRYFLFIFFLLMQVRVDGQQSVSGIVTNENGQALTGVVVRISDTYISTSTDALGSYRIDKISGTQVHLEFRLIGYSTHKVWVDLSKSNTYNCTLRLQPFMADEVVILATRADEKSGMAYSNLQKEDIARNNFGTDIPILLGNLPSVVSNSDAGTGIGYTGIRVRGSDATRTNITINGIPYNDAESHGVFLVNMPDFASSVKSIQLQRGVGSSTNGAGAFGASINMQTNDLRGDPYAGYTLSGGSFNTLRNTFEAGTGLVKGFTFDIRLSKITSDGYINRASSELQSWYTSAGWYRKRSSMKLNIFSGNEKTYQAWYGVPQDSLKTNRRYNPAGAYRDANGRELFYDNETDNYRQSHYQFFLNHEFSRNALFTMALHYTRGSGYYEQYRQQEQFLDYGAENFVQKVAWNSDSTLADTIKSTDLIRQRWLDNHFYGTVFSLTMNPDKRSKIIAGGGINQYRGKHFGEVIWAQYASTIPRGLRYYDNDAVKSDFNFYVKVSRDLSGKLTATADIQYRTVWYSFLGYNNLLENVQQQVNLHFINPKLALHYDLNALNRLFLSWSVGNREPVRDDFTQSTPASRPEPEQLHDFELGYRMGRKKVELSATAYYMHYINQLVLTGAVNDVGAYTRTNIRDSYRTGVEIEAGWKVWKNLTFSGNIALSENKIRSPFREVLFDYESNTEVSFIYKKTNISFSPAIVAAADITYTIGRWAHLSLIGKYVGKQFLDNTSSDLRKLDPFSVFSFRFGIKPAPGLKPNVDLSVQLNNILNADFSPNGYTFSDMYGAQRNDYNYYFPQAGTNVMLMLKVTID